MRWFRSYRPGPEGWLPSCSIGPGFTDDEVSEVTVLSCISLTNEDLVDYLRYLADSLEAARISCTIPQEQRP